MKLSWATDIHLDHVDDQTLINFGESVRAEDSEALIITGDISNAKDVVYHLSSLEKVVKKRVYFVLGNHDYYGSTIANVRKVMSELSSMAELLKYMPTISYVPLSKKTALIGHDGWYDALYGNYKSSRFAMNDWRAIGEFYNAGALMMLPRPYSVGYEVNYDKVVKVAQSLAQDAVAHVSRSIKEAVRYHDTIVIITHVPPFAESHIYEGKVGEPDKQPWYTSKMMGDMLLRAANIYTNVRFEVFAGHTHGKFDGKIRDNLHVHVGHSAYGSPKSQGVIELP